MHYTLYFIRSRVHYAGLFTAVGNLNEKDVKILLAAIPFLRCSSTSWAILFLITWQKRT